LAYLLLLSILLELLLAGTVVTYRTFAAEAEAQAVDGIVATADHDARLLADRWHDIAREAEGLRTMAVALTRIQRTGDTAATDQAMETLRLAISLSRSGMAAVEAWDDAGTLRWSTAIARPTGVCEPAPADRERLWRDGRLTFSPRSSRSSIVTSPTLCFGALDREGNGAATGFTTVAFQTDSMLTLMRRVKRQQDAVITILGNKSIVLAGGVGQEVGVPLPTSPSLTRSKTDDGLWVGRGKNPATGADEITIARDVPGTELSVAVSLNENKALAGVREFQGKLRTAAADIFGLMTFLLVLVLSAWRRDKADRDARAAVAATRAQDEMLHQIASRSRDIIGALDETFHFVYVNESVRTAFGLAPSDLIGREAGRRMAKADLLRLIESIRSMPADAPSFRANVPISAPDGRTVVLESEFSRIQLPGPSGQTRPGWLFICRDVTARDRTEKELREAIQELQQVADHIPGILYRGIGHENGTFQLHYVSTKNGLLLGYKEMVWRSPGFITSIVHPDDLVCLDQMREDLKRTGTAVVEYRLRHADGQYMWFRNSSTVVGMENGQYLLMGFAQDVTVEKDQDAKLEEARRLLALNELASGIGHELGQPLQAISLSARNALMHLDRGPGAIAKVRDKLERISAMVERAGDTVQKLRELSDADSHEPARSNVTEVVEASLAATRDRLDLVRVASRVDIADGLPEAAIQPALLRKVLTALLVNACDTYRGMERNDPHGRLVTIEAREDQGQVLMTVGDRAGGLSPAVVRRIFEPFFNPQGPEAGGGLGLAVSHGIVQKAGGSLTARVAEGGLVFDIRLPRAGRPASTAAA
jgi:PAS domain S-box-containing protein